MHGKKGRKGYFVGSSRSKEREGNLKRYLLPDQRVAYTEQIHVCRNCLDVLLLLFSHSFTDVVLRVYQRLFFLHSSLLSPIFAITTSTYNHNASTNNLVFWIWAFPSSFISHPQFHNRVMLPIYLSFPKYRYVLPPCSWWYLSWFVAILIYHTSQSIPAVFVSTYKSAVDTFASFFININPSFLHNNILIPVVFLIGNTQWQQFTTHFDWVVLDLDAALPFFLLQRELTFQ